MGRNNDIMGMGRAESSQPDGKKTGGRMWLQQGGGRGGQAQLRGCMHPAARRRLPASCRYAACWKTARSGSMMATASSISFSATPASLMVATRWPATRSKCVSHKPLAKRRAWACRLQTAAKGQRVSCAAALASPKAGICCATH